jgi:hypothetical protein
MAAHAFPWIFPNILPIMDVILVLFLFSLSGGRQTLRVSDPSSIPVHKFIHNLIELTIQGLSAFFLSPMKPQLSVLSCGEDSNQ